MTTLAQSESDGVIVLRVCGPLTQDAVEDVRGAFESAIFGSPRVVVDLSNVPVMTTPGLSMLLRAAGQLGKAGGLLVVTGAAGIVDDLLQRCRLGDVLHVVVDPGTAVRTAKEHAITGH